jgi:hypothetical protein
LHTLRALHKLLYLRLCAVHLHSLALLGKVNPMEGAEDGNFHTM